MSYRNPISALGLAAVLLLPGAVLADTGVKAKANLQDTAGKAIGTVELEQTPHGTLLHARLENMPEGVHAFHVHQTGKCEAPFKSAGGHFNPAGEKHGFRVKEGHHAGDLPNIHVPANGKLEIEYFNSSLALSEALFDQDGAAIVIHEGADDYKTDPAGAAGSRIACGVIKRAE